MSLKILKEEDFEELTKNNYFYQLTYGRKLCAEPHTHDFYEIICVIEGECVQVINNKKLSMFQGDVTILRPKDVHSFFSQSDNTNLLALSITRMEMASFFEAYGNGLEEKMTNCKSVTKMSLTYSQQCEINTGYEQTMMSDNKQKGIHLKIILGKFIHMYMLYCYKAQENTPSKLAEALAKMNTFEYAAQGVQALIKLSNFSHAHLYRLMKKYENITPQKYIFNLRMNMAYDLIRNSNLDFESISEKVGYSSFGHFCSAFKKKFNITPALLRKISNNSIVI